MIKNRKEMLEARITRLEKLIKKAKFESENRPFPQDEVEQWFWDNCTEDAFDDRQEWKDSLFALERKSNDIPVSLCVDDLFEADEDVDWDRIADIFAELATQLINEEGLRWERDDYDEACHRRSKRKNR